MITDFKFEPCPDSFSGKRTFISYRRVDIGKIGTLPLQLHRYGGPTSYFWYDRGIYPGDEWEEVILSNLKKSSCVVAFISENLFVNEPGADIPYMKKELELALNLKKPIIPICINGYRPDMRSLSDDNRKFWEQITKHQIVDCERTFDRQLLERVHTGISRAFAHDRKKSGGEGQLKGSGALWAGLFIVGILLAILVLTLPDKDTEPPFSLDPPVFTSYSSSSAINNGSKKEYNEIRAFDGNYDTCWQENIPGSGIGEWVMCSAFSTQYVNSITIYPGHCASQSGFDRNGRPLSMEVRLGDETRTVSITDDFMTPTTVSFDSPVPCTSVRFTILDAIPGLEWDDTAIAEIIIE